MLREKVDLGSCFLIFLFYDEICIFNIIFKLNELFLIDMKDRVIEIKKFIFLY